MSEAKITLDRSRIFSENRGERTPEDPEYRVHYRQGGKVGGHIILLPFDVHGNLVPDDGKTAPWAGTNSEGKPCTYHPLYTKSMRDYLRSKLERMKQIEAAPGTVTELDGSGDSEDLGAGAPEDEVNFVSWLKGDVRYPAGLIRAAATKRFAKKYGSKLSEIVVDLVLDEKILPEDQVCPELAKFLPTAVAA
jgi:hypothetical protein